MNGLQRAKMLRESSLGKARLSRVERFPRVRFPLMKVSAAVTINLEAEFTGFSMIGAETGAAIGTDLSTRSPTNVTVAVMHNLDAAVYWRSHNAALSQGRASTQRFNDALWLIPFSHPSIGIHVICV
jgi:hypothetical protein